ncbi:unnamed protein product [Heligmosomoides polygyrus]|uniref:Polyketide_cyc domain-containing protein n=1 Tax=Heligmosomoides polygyrus TaxID=6339 RepID=A0A183FVX3_HELPZ|nr:unnamed protein product [Heligmosomoides polygyrus]
MKFTLDERDIDSVEDWERYIAKVENDGEIKAEVCHVVNSQPLQIKYTVKAMRENIGKALQDRESGLGKSTVQYSDSLDARKPIVATSMGAARSSDPALSTSTRAEVFSS